MPKDDGLQKVTLNLRTGDWDYLADIFASQGYPTSVVVRNIIAKYVDAIRAQDKTPELPMENVDI